MMKSGTCRSGDGDTRVRYTVLKEDDTHTNCDRDDMSENSPLLENIERLNIGSTKTVTKTPAKSLPAIDKSKSKKGKKSGVVDKVVAVNSDKNKTEDAVKTETIEEREESTDTFNEAPKCMNARSRRGLEITEDVIQTPNTSKQNGDDHLDIVRKMSQPMAPNYIPWQKIGSYQTLKQKSCQRLYAATNRSDDVALFFQNGRFYAMEAWCTHMGGPLYQGDIEDYNGKSHVMCPWHSYMFDLETGKNEIGLQQKIYELKYEAGSIYIRYHCPVTTEPVGRKLSQDQSKSSEISIQKVKERKKSVLDSPLSLS